MKQPILAHGIFHEVGCIKSTFKRSPGFGTKSLTTHFDTSGHHGSFWVGNVFRPPAKASVQATSSEQIHCPTPPCLYLLNAHCLSAHHGSLGTYLPLAMIGRLIGFT